MFSIGEPVTVYNKLLPTFGRSGHVITNDSDDKRKIRVDFGTGWQGYYYESDLTNDKSRKIYKYKILPPFTEIDVQTGSKILTVHCQDDDICVWVEIFPNVTTTEKRKIIPIATGEKYEVPCNKDYIFLGTVFMFHNSLVFHIFEEKEKV